jgi:hypothetical protein
MSVEIAKKRGRPKKVADMHGIFPAALPPATAAATSKLSVPKKSNKQLSSTSTATKKSNGSKSKAADASISQKELKTKIATVTRAASSKIVEKSEPDPNSPPPPPAVLKAIAIQESSSILQQIAALKVEEELKKKAAGLSTTPPVPPTQQTAQLATLPSLLEPLAIPSFQSTTMPSTSTPPSTFYQWLPNPPILAQRQLAFRTLSTTSNPTDATRKARALNRLATEASIPKTKEGLNPGGFPVTYKSATRRVTAIIVAMPIALCMSWFLYERCESPI